MLQHLHISNYALIDRLDIDVEAGYTVITGETGAGKSILLGALGLMLGARADARVVKQGEQKCVVEAVFRLGDTDSARLRSLCDENDIDFDAEECVIRRELTSAGKSRAFVNDTPVLLSVLKPLGALLVDIHSQHQNQMLGSEDFLLQTLDLVARNAEERETYSTAFSAYTEARRRLAELRRQAEKDSLEQELLRAQYQQLEELNPQEGEQQELEEEQRMLTHAEDIKVSLNTAMDSLSNEQYSLAQQLRQCQNALAEAERHLSSVAGLSERVESVRIEMDDIEAEIAQQQEHVDFNPQRMQYVDDRLSLLYQLERRHGVNSDSELIALKEELASRLDAIDNIDDEVARCQRVADEARASLLSAAQALTATRRSAGAAVEKALMEMLSTLGMPNGRVEFALAALAEPREDGMDGLCLRFSANKNVPMQDVQDIASGGEVARLMLALKAYTAQYRQLPTIIFDEIDTGVSGSMAERMGEIMKDLAQHCQVLCITHLPQIASLGQHHFWVHKEEDALGTHSHIVPLDAEGRVQEIANMLSGSQVSEAALNNARTLLGLQ